MDEMRSPPPSSDVFLFSPSHYSSNGPAEEVQTLLASAFKVESLKDNLSIAINSDKQRFLEVFGRHVQLLKSRSQAFEDAHITVYDKVLLSLTNNGNDLESPAAITWYCAEYLGIQTDGDTRHNSHLINQAVVVPLALCQAMTPATTRKNSEISTNPSLSTTAKTEVNPSSRNDPKFAQLWKVYSKAHAEYRMVADKRDNNTLEAAKFLRDTAENGIFYLQNKYPQDPALQDLNNTLNMTKQAVLTMNGGRKRKFDDSGSKSDANRQSRTATQNRANAERRRRNKDGSVKEQRRGRGPSGIPFGYSRPVDSYCPT